MPGLDPTCTINALTSVNGQNVAAGSLVTVQLTNVAVNNWQLLCIGTDETNVAATINAGITINATTRTATFTAPASGSALILQSTAIGASGPGVSTTLGVYVLSATSRRVFAVNETVEGSAAFGWLTKINPLIRSIASASATISAITPTQGTAAGGTAVTITGTGYAAGASVLIDGFACTGVVIVNPTTITCNTPAHVTIKAACDVSVANFGGLSATLVGAFAYIFTVDFTALAAGTLAAGAAAGSVFEAATGLRLARLDAGWVQTSDRALVSAAIDAARIGQMGTSSLNRGLVLEPDRTNFLIQSRDNNNAAWSGKTATVTGGAATGPDGTAASAARVTAVAGNQSNFQIATTGTANPDAYSMWVKAHDNATFYTSKIATDHSVTPSFYSALPTWSKVEYPDPLSDGFTTGYHVPVYSVPAATDVDVDFAVVEKGKICGEPIVTTTATATVRGDRLFLSVGSGAVSAGRIRSNHQFLAKGPSASAAGAQRLWTDNTTPANYAEISAAGVVKTVIGGVTVTFATAIPWANRLDLVQVFLEVGNGTSKLTTSINGSTPLVQTDATALAAFAPSGALDVQCNAATSQLWAWTQKVEFYP